MRSNRRFVVAIAIVFLVTAGFLAQRQKFAFEITPEGRELAKTLDQMDVEHRWLAGKIVKWDTGEPLDRPTTDDLPHTHCSAFVAAAAEKLGIYILRPPKHSPTLLASAQYDWLPADGRKEGWKSVANALEAQQLANRGSLVVAVCKESDPNTPGHIAIVRPSEKSKTQIEEEGPQIIQAGMNNFSSASLKDGFAFHQAAFCDNLIRFYVHPVPANRKS